MKYLILTLFVFSVITGFSQDTIIANGHRFPVIITSCGETTIKFIKINDPYHEIHEKSRKLLDKIIYEEAPKGSNLIVFQSDSLKDLQLMKAFVFLLKNRGFTFEELDKDFFIIETRMKKIKKSYNVKVSVSINNNQAMIRTYGVGDIISEGFLYYGTGVVTSSRDNTNYRGVKKGSTSRYDSFAFAFGEQIAKEFKAYYGGKIFFKKEQ